MRLKSNLWVKAYLRRAAIAGAFGAVLRHGDDDAGAIYIRISNHRGDAVLYGPAPVYALSEDGGRKWYCLSARGQEIDNVVKREQKMDPDLWLIEIEDKAGRSFLDDNEIHVDV